MKYQLALTFLIISATATPLRVIQTELSPTCVIEATPTTVNRGELLRLTAKSKTPGFAESSVTYEYRWKVYDSQGKPVTFSGSGTFIEIPTFSLACGNYTAEVSVAASVQSKTGRTSCDTSFEVTEPPCPTVTCTIAASPSSVVQSGTWITLRAKASGADSPSFTWTTTGGTLSSTTGAEVILDTTGITVMPDLSPATVTITVNVGTSRTRCDQPCPGGSCSTTLKVMISY